MSRITYQSTQETECAVCGLLKHTPLRNDDMGGDVCLTCIVRELEKLQAIVNVPKLWEPPSWRADLPESANGWWWLKPSPGAAARIVKLDASGAFSPGLPHGTPWLPQWAGPLPEPPPNVKIHPHERRE